RPCCLAQRLAQRTCASSARGLRSFRATNSRTCHGWHQMANFFRVLRLVLRYKWTLAASSFTAIMVALLWGSNIGGAFPVLAVIAQNKSLQQWIDGEIESSQTRIQKLETESNDLQAQLAGAQAANITDLQSQLRTIGRSLQAERKRLGRFQFFK